MKGERNRQIFAKEKKRQTQKYQIWSKSFQWEQNSMRMDRMTDMTKLIVAFRNFMNASKKTTNHSLLKCYEIL